MIEKVPTRRSSSVPARLPAAALRLQRKCACGGSSAFAECDECAKKKLQRKTRQAAEGDGLSTSPPIVHDVLISPGQPLDRETRSSFEARFGHDFSKVRVHTDDRAARSAHAVNAMAYTVGHNVVFASGQYKPRTVSGKSLLAHELTHVVQQHGQTSGSPLCIGNASDPSEQQAEKVAGDLGLGLNHGSHRLDAGARTAPQLMRKLSVLNPADPIPNPDGKGLKQTNAETVEGYLKTMAEGSGVTVDRTSGEISVSTGYCPGFAGGFLAGAKTGFGIFKKIPLLNLLLGGPAALIGGLIGGIGGLFGSQGSAAASSATPTGSTCLCDILDSSQPWQIEINDEFPDKKYPLPTTQSSKKIVTPSPNNPKIMGAATLTGKLENEEPWLLLAHELCGHAWLQVKQKPETSEPVSHAYRDPKTGQMVSDPVTKDSPAPHGHEFAVEKENLIRKEHGLDPRGWRLKDPYCGESFLRDKAAPEAAPEFYPDTGSTVFTTLLEQCQYLRSQLPESKNKTYRIDEAIP
jgi:hypothetical protein